VSILLAAVALAACGSEAPPVETADAGHPDWARDSGGEPIDAAEPQDRPPLEPRDASADATDAPETSPPIATIVHWQDNSDWGEVSDAAHDAFFQRVAEYPEPPDVLAIQQLYPNQVCGSSDGRMYDYWDRDTASCTHGIQPGSFLGKLSRFVPGEWDGVVNHSTAVFWRTERFTKTDFFTWSDSDAGCGSDIAKWQNAVRLIDHRGTIAETDDRFIVVASMHEGAGPGCIEAHVRYLDREVRTRFEDGMAPHAQPAFVFFSGDWNYRADHTSSSAAEQRAEIHPDCWWRRVTGTGPIGGCGEGIAAFIDVVHTMHPGGGTYSDTRPICSEVSWINTPPNPARCDSSRSVSTWQRIDYVLLRGTAATEANLVSADTDQGDYEGTKYSGHRAIRTIVSYR